MIQCCIDVYTICAVWNLKGIKDLIQEIGNYQPIYRRIAREIRQRIQIGELGVGAQLPTEKALCAHYGVSRMTVRQALVELSHNGFITSRRGLGTFVASDKAERISGRLLGFLEDAQAHGLNPHTAVVDQGWVTTSKEDALLLGVATQARLYQVRRLRFTNNEPIGLNNILLTETMAAQLHGADFSQSFYQLLNQHLGTEVQLAEQRVEAVSPSKDLSQLLGVPSNAPLLKTTRVTYLRDGRLVGLTRTYYRGDRYYLSLTIDRDPFLKGGDG